MPRQGKQRVRVENAPVGNVAIKPTGWIQRTGPRRTPFMQADVRWWKAKRAEAARAARRHPGFERPDRIIVKAKSHKRAVVIG
jgi:hypothetical protein